MIIFKKLTYRNFLSAGNYDTVIELNKSNTTLIVGPNGSGKSTILDALSFSLFGKPYRNISKSQLVNSINEKNCLVTIEFSIGNNNYVVKRGIKPNIFEIYLNDKLLNQESHNYDYQKILENNILKLSHKSFNQIVILGSSNFIPFMQLPTNIRREVIEDLLDITIFSKMNFLLKGEYLKIKDQFTHLETNIKLLDERIRLSNIHLEKLKSIKKDSETKIENEIKELDFQIKNFENRLKILEEEYSKMFSSYNEKLNKLKNKKSECLKYKSLIEEKINNIKNHVEFFNKNSSCPTCLQIIPETLKESKNLEFKTKNEEYSKGLNLLNDSLEQFEKKIHSLSNEFDQVNDLKKEIDLIKNKIFSFKEQKTNLIKKKNESKEFLDLENELKKLKEYDQERNSLNLQRQELIEEKAYTELLLDLLKDTGIKTKIIQQYIPVINHLVNKYLQMMDFFVSFNLDENFNEQIKSRHRDEFSYSSFSEGEKQRIDLALLFTWRHIAKMKNSNSTNLLIFDEILDSSLDFDGIDNFLKILESMDLNNNSNVFIISHKTDAYENKFGNKIVFSKVNNFSKKISE